jgi:hypothetical protein
MPAFASELFRTIIKTKPERLWEALTATGSPSATCTG